MSVRAQVEAIIYATEEPVTLKQLASLLRESVLAELRSAEEARLALNETVADGSSLPDHEGLANESVQAADAEQPGSETTEYFDGERQTSDDLSKEQQYEADKAEAKQVKAYLAQVLDELTAEYAAGDHGVEVRQIAGGYRMGTKPEHHDVVVRFAKSLKPPVRLSLQALETLAVIAYKQPVTVPEISEIRGVDSSGVIATLLDRKLITTGGRKQVIGRPILYKTTKEFLLRFGLNNVSELPSMEEFEKLGDPQADLFDGTAEGINEVEAASAPETTDGLDTANEPVPPDTEAAAVAQEDSAKNSQD